MSEVATQTYRIAHIEETSAFIDEIKAQVGKYWGFYLYNPAEPTYCCELRPSYWLECFGFETENEISDMVYDELWSYLYDSSHYRLVQAVEQLDTCEVVGDFDNFEDAREYVQANYSWKGKQK